MGTRPQPLAFPRDDAPTTRRPGSAPRAGRGAGRGMAEGHASAAVSGRESGHSYRSSKGLHSAWRCRSGAARGCASNDAILPAKGPKGRREGETPSAKPLARGKPRRGRRDSLRCTDNLIKTASKIIRTLDMPPSGRAGILRDRGQPSKINLNSKPEIEIQYISMNTNRKLH